MQRMAEDRRVMTKRAHLLEPVADVKDRTPLRRQALQRNEQVVRLLDEIRKEANNDSVLKRNDLAAIYQESARWQGPKS